MDGEEILVKLKDRIYAHANLDCSIYQAPYKDDYFKLFLEAYKGNYFDVSSHPRLTGQAIKDTFIERWLGEENEYNDRRLKLLNAVLAMWDEWFYALDKVGVNI
jgi:hypothetical protein